MEKPKKERTWLKDTPYAKDWHPTKNEPIRLEELYHQSSKKVWWKCSVCEHEWQLEVAKRTDGRECPNCRLMRQSLAAQAPHVLSAWDDKKNAPFTPETIFAKTSKKMWWKCEHGHSYQMNVSYRIRLETCPLCKQEKRQKERALMKHYPQLAKEWHPTKNQHLDLKTISVGSQKRVWWQCEHGHEWESIVANRIRQENCPICQKESKLREGSFGVRHPDLINEWHPTKNETLTPFDVLAKSNQKVWWQCEHGHEWEATILSRSNGSGCLTCYHDRNIHHRSVARCSPDLVSEWHPTKNETLQPHQISYRSGRKVWWQCEHGHEWQASPNVRYTTKGCPICRKNQKKLSLIHPEYESWFDAKKNAPLQYEELLTTSNEPIWWCCDHGHQRQVTVKSFLKRPYCKTCRELEMNDFKDSLAQCHPELLLEWHPMKNQELSPHYLKATSTQSVWWQCNRGHEWEAKIAVRSYGAGCPICRKEQRLAYQLEETSLSVLQQEWHPTKNVTDRLETCFPSGRQEVWWRCRDPRCGHEWEDSVIRRLKGHGCPECRILMDSVAHHYPNLAKQWCVEKNLPLKVDRFYHKSAKTVWWQCHQGHFYRRTLATQLLYPTCPKCIKQQVSQEEKR